MLCSYVFNSCAGQRGLGTGVGVPAPDVVPPPPGGQMSQAGPSLRQASCAREDCVWRCLGAPDAWGCWWPGCVDCSSLPLTLPGGMDPRPQSWE